MTGLFNFNLLSLTLELVGDQVDILRDFLQNNTGVCCLGFSSAIVIHIPDYGYVIASIDENQWFRFREEEFERAAAQVVSDYELALRCGQ